MLDFKLLVRHSLIRQAWPLLLAFLACMSCCNLAVPALAAGRIATLAASRISTHRFLHLNDEVKQVVNGEKLLRLKLERLQDSFADRSDALRAAIYRDQARRERLKRRILAGADDGIAPGGAPSAAGGNSSAANAHKGGGLASLDVISGSSVGSGEYFATVWVGTPPQKLFLIADTGSDLTWVKCSNRASRKPAFGIGKSKTSVAVMNQSFDEGASSSFAPLSCLSQQCAAWFFPPTCDGLSRHCKFSYSYTDQSFIAGSLAFESITLGKGAEANLVLGCGRQYEGPNFDKAGGVVGLGQGPLSLTSQLATQSVYSNKFSYCLADFFGPSSISGSLAFGETLSQTTLRYTPLIQNPFVQTFYYVGVERVKVGGIELDIPVDVWEIDVQGNGGTIVDSGTTLAQFAQPAYDTIREAFRQAIKYPTTEDTVEGLDLCYNTNGVTNLQFPEFAIVFQGGLVFEPPQDNYFTETGPGIKCLAMQGAPATSFSVVGNLLQQNYHIEFDRLHNQLGVSPTDCSKLHS